MISSARVWDSWQRAVGSRFCEGGSEMYSTLHNDSKTYADPYRRPRPPKKKSGTKGEKVGHSLIIIIVISRSNAQMR